MRRNRTLFTSFVHHFLAHGMCRSQVALYRRNKMPTLLTFLLPATLPSRVRPCSRQNLLGSQIACPVDSSPATATATAATLLSVVNYAACSPFSATVRQLSLVTGGSLVRAGVSQLLTLMPAKGAKSTVITNTTANGNDGVFYGVYLHYGADIKT